MEFAELIRVAIMMQEALNALTTVRAERHRVLKLIQVAEDNDTVLTPEIIERELDDLKQAIEEARASIPAEPQE